MILSDGQILDAYKDGGIMISPFDDEMVQPASYDLKVGSEIVTTSRNKKIDLEAEGYVTLKPGDFAVVTVLEELKLGPQYVGRFGLRSGFARSGLIATTGPQIDPGYHGRLIVGITNLTPHDIPITYADRFLTVEFHRLDQPAFKPYSGPYNRRFGLTNDEIKIVSEKDGVPLVKVFKSVEEMKHEVKGLVVSSNTLKWAIGLGFGVLSLIIAIK